MVAVRPLASISLQGTIIFDVFFINLIFNSNRSIIIYTNLIIIVIQDTLFKM